MSGLSRTPGKRVYGESRTAGSNPALSAKRIAPSRGFLFGDYGRDEEPASGFDNRMSGEHSVGRRHIFLCRRS